MGNLKRRQYMSWYRLLLIAIIGTLVFNFYPLIETFITSLKNMNGSFIGFTNYKILFSSDEFRQSIINTLYMAVLGVGLNVPLAFIIASVLNSIAHGKGIYRVIFLLPMVMSMITVVTLFKYMMMPSADGVFNYILSFFGVAPKLWLNDPKAARECVVLIAVWKGIGYNIILFFAGLQGISADMYEAAEIDGANAFKRFIYITLPLMKPAMLSVLMLGFIYTFKAFDLMYIMTAGGPFNSTDVLGTYAYSKAFTQYEFSQGSAIAMVLFACLFLVGIFYLKLLSKEDD